MERLNRIFRDIIIKMKHRKEELNKDKEPSGYTVHHVLAHSYSFFLTLFLFGFFLDLVFPIKIFSSSIMASVGWLFLISSTVLIFWAQKTSRNLDDVKKIKTETFCHGPYCYTRSPTHFGLFFLTLGFGILINAFFVVLFTLISIIITKVIFIKKEESILAKKYGSPYLEYKKIVKF